MRWWYYSIPSLWDSTMYEVKPLAWIILLHSPGVNSTMVRCQTMRAHGPDVKTAKHASRIILIIHQPSETLSLSSQVAHVAQICKGGFCKGEFEVKVRSPALCVRTVRPRLATYRA